MCDKVAEPDDESEGHFIIILILDLQEVDLGLGVESAEVDMVGRHPRGGFQSPGV